MVEACFAAILMHYEDRVQADEMRSVNIRLVTTLLEVSEDRPWAGFSRDALQGLVRQWGETIRTDFELANTHMRWPASETVRVGDGPDALTAALRQVSTNFAKQNKQLMELLSDLRKQVMLLEQRVGVLRVQAELQGIKQQLERCRLGPAEAATPSPRRASLPASSLPASSPTAMAVDEDAADAALFGEDAEAVEPVRPFPSLWAARANDTPLKDFLEMGVSMMYLNIKLSHNVLPSFALRKQKMYVKEIVRTFDFFATDAELESFRQARSPKERTGEQRTAAGEIEESVRLLFATIFKALSGVVPPNF